MFPFKVKVAFLEMCCYSGKGFYFEGYIYQAVFPVCIIVFFRFHYHSIHNWQVLADILFIGLHHSHRVDLTQYINLCDSVIPTCDVLLNQV